MMPLPFPDASTGRRWIIILAMVGFVATMDLTLTAILIEPMKRAMALSDVDIGLLQGSAFGLAFGLASIPIGRLIDRYDRIRMLRVGLVLWTAAVAGTGLAPSFFFFVFCWFLLGVVVVLFFFVVVLFFVVL